MSCHVMSCHVMLWYFGLSYSVLYHRISLCYIWSRRHLRPLLAIAISFQTLFSFHILLDATTSCLTFPHPTLSYPILPYLNLPYPSLPYLIFCLTLPNCILFTTPSFLTSHSSLILMFLPLHRYLNFLKVGPKLLKWLPGNKASDLRTWLTVYSYWSEGTYAIKAHNSLVLTC